MKNNKYKELKDFENACNCGTSSSSVFENFSKETQ